MSLLIVSDSTFLAWRLQFATLPQRRWDDNNHKIKVRTISNQTNRFNCVKNWKAVGIHTIFTRQHWNSRRTALFDAITFPCTPSTQQKRKVFTLGEKSNFREPIKAIVKHECVVSDAQMTAIEKLNDAISCEVRSAFAICCHSEFRATVFLKASWKKNRNVLNRKQPSQSQLRSVC